MGNECDQCEAVTEGCKRQQFRTQLKNREKLDFSRGQSNQKNKSKLQAINNLRNNTNAYSFRNQNNEDIQNDQSSVEIFKNHKPPYQQKYNNDQYYPSIKKTQKSQESIEESEQKEQNQKRQGYKRDSDDFQELNFIKLPMQSGIERKNNKKLQELEKNLLLSRQPPKKLQQKNKTKNEQNHSNSTIHIEDRSPQQSNLLHDDKQNSPIKKSEFALITSSKSKMKKQQLQESLRSNLIASSNPSKVLKQFNNDLKESPIRPSLDRLPKSSIYHNDDERPYDEESFTSPINTIQQETFYIRPGVYFQGFISTINKKLQSEGTIVFQSDQTQLLVNFQNGNLNYNKNTILTFADGSTFQGKIRTENEKSEFMACGEGKFVYPDGAYYVGEWLKNFPHGKGKHKFADGSSYEGEFIEGRKQGQGKFATSEGDLIYIGSFLNNRMEGTGQMSLIDPNTGKKRIYKGYFKNGKLQGQNCQALYIDQEAKYIGSFHDGKKCGYGRYYYGDGRIWEGEWKDNRQNGHGRFKNEKGAVVEGYWIDGIKNDVRPSK